MLDGIILVNKPKGWSSFDVVAKVRGSLKRETGLKKVKVGHTGTLDPLATGLMIVVVGAYCKRAAEFSKLDKTYHVTMKLGQTSDTGDEEGIKTAVSDTQPDVATIASTLQQFVGEIQQTPPIYSAIKVGGQRAYKLARAGKEVVIEPRTIVINEIIMQSYDYPIIKFSADVGSGTYIRSLVDDVGKELQTGAYMSDLVRVKVGRFDLDSEVLGPEEIGIAQVIGL